MLGLFKDKINVRVFRSISEIPKGDLNGLVELYQEVFGEFDPENGSVWGEGAYCEKEGKVRKIDLNTYLKLKTEGRAVCGCGGRFLEYHPKNEVLDRLKENFKDDKGILVLLTDHNNIIGFAWASILCKEDLSKKLFTNVENSHAPENLLGHINGSDILFFEEIAIKNGFRKGLKPIKKMAKPIVTYSLDNSISEMVFRTSVNSRINSFAKTLKMKKGNLNEHYFVYYLDNLSILKQFLR